MAPPWASHFENDDENERYGRPGSLRQSLLNAAATWEAEREREQRQHRAELQSARSATAAVNKMVEEEREKVQSLEADLKATTALLHSEKASSEALAKELRTNRLQVSNGTHKSRSISHMDGRRTWQANVDEHHIP